MGILILAIATPLLLLAAFMILPRLRTVGGHPKDTGRRLPRKWRIPIRIVCGLAGLGLLGALAHGTWRETQAGYDVTSRA